MSCQICLIKRRVRKEVSNKNEKRPKIISQALFRIIIIWGSHSGGPGHARVKRVFALCRDLLKLFLNSCCLLNILACFV